MSRAHGQLGSSDQYRDRFMPLVAEKLGYYVYALRDPRNDQIFYAGKGVGDRVYQHARNARKVDRHKTHSELQLDRIHKIHDADKEVGIEIIRHRLESEEAAFEVEAAVIDALRVAGVPLTNVVAGHGVRHRWRPLAELEGEYAARPVDIKHPLLLIRLSDLPTDENELYRRTRQWWKLDGKRAGTRQFGLGVYQGVVRAVYRIEGWEQPSASDIKQRRKRRGRWGFVGSPDPEAEKLYLYGDVQQYLPARGGQNPIRYVDP